MTPTAASCQNSDFKPVLIAGCLAMLAVGDNSTAIMAGLPDMKASLQLGFRTDITSW